MFNKSYYFAIPIKDKYITFIFSNKLQMSNMLDKYNILYFVFNNKPKIKKEQKIKSKVIPTTRYRVGNFIVLFQSTDLEIVLNYYNVEYEKHII